MGMADSAGLLVRDAIPADAASLASLFLRARASSTPGLRKPCAEDAVATWLARMPMQDHRVRVATIRGETAGYIGHGQDAAHGAMVLHLYLDPAGQHRGIGPHLLHEAIAAHAAAPLSRICFARIAGGRAFHEAHGFRPTANRCGAANEEGEPDIVYTRDAGPVLPPPREDQP